MCMPYNWLNVINRLHVITLLLVLSKTLVKYACKRHIICFRKCLIIGLMKLLVKCKCLIIGLMQTPDNWFDANA